MASVITKRKAKLMILRKDIDTVTACAKAYNRAVMNTAINNTRATFSFADIESDPIWLLDLRRSGVPYLWIWGDDFRDFRFATALRMDDRGRGHTNRDLRSSGSSDDQFLFENAVMDFQLYEFPEDQPVMPYVDSSPMLFAPA